MALFSPKNASTVSFDGGKLISLVSWISAVSEDMFGSALKISSSSSSDFLLKTQGAEILRATFVLERKFIIVESLIGERLHSPNRLRVSFGFRNRSINDIYFETPQCTQPFSAEVQYYLRKAYHLFAEEMSQATVNHSALLKKASLIFSPGDMVIVITSGRGTIAKANLANGPFILLNLIASNIWRMFKLEDGLTISVAEYPVSMLKKYQPCDLIKGLPCQPPIPHNDPSKLKRNDLIIARNSDDFPPTVGLFKILTVDPAAEQVIAKVWRPNQLLEFYETEALATIPWKCIILSRIKLGSRMIPEPVQKAIFSLLGGRL